MGPQNGRRGLERCLPLGFGLYKKLLINKFFDPSPPSMRKSLNGGGEKRVKRRKAGAELGQAQLKLGLDLTSTNLH